MAYGTIRSQRAHLGQNQLPGTLGMLSLAA